MIPQAKINAWRSQSPWRSDSMVEQDLLICRTIVELFRRPVLAEHLAFRGGTALHKLYFCPARRYSEDIDLVQTKAGPIGPVFDAIQRTLNELLGKPKRKQGPGVATVTYRILPELPPAVPMKLKIEINSREHFAALGVRNKKFAMASPWFSGECEIPTFSLEELLGTKLRALYQRRKGRDLFDLWLGLTEGGADPQRVVEVFRAYMDHEGHKVSRAEFAENLLAKKANPLFTADLDSLLPVDFSFDFAAAFELAEREIVSRM
jgi:predicted nucleotidyltransferase component of viral defense system